MRRILLPLALTLTIFAAAAGAQASEPRKDEAEIRQLALSIWDRADQPLTIEPIIVDGTYAVADWSQGDAGGRALLQKRSGTWKILACSGDAFKSADALAHFGTPRATAIQLTKRLAAAEATVDPKRIARFSTFDGVITMDGSDPHAGAHGTGPASKGVPAQAAPVASPALPAPAAVMDYGAIAVEKHGASGAPLVLIPGLAGGAWSWAETIRRLAPTHAVYVLTLAGFSGRPAVPTPLIDHVVADIARFVRDNQLDRPTIIGHSLGAFVAFRLAIAHPDLIGGLIAVDGFPVFSPLAEADAGGRAAAAKKLAQELAVGKNPAEFHAALLNFLTARMNDPVQAAQAADLAARSDPEATAEYIIEMLSADLRPELSKLTMPVLALVAENSYKRGLPEPEIRAFYARVLSNAPQGSIALIRNARHFAMVDQPDVVAAAIEGFAAGRRLASR